MVTCTNKKGCFIVYCESDTSRKCMDSDVENTVQLNVILSWHKHSYRFFSVGLYFSSN
jgi:hypothetical protein